MTMIERVARAIDPLAWNSDPSDRDYTPAQAAKDRQESLRLALVAIKAMREPTEEMLIAGMEGALKENAQYLEDISHNSHSWSAVHVALGNSKTAAAVFHGMIDAALQEGKETVG